MDGGNYYQYCGTFEDLISELKVACYAFEEPPLKGVDYSRWVLNKGFELGRQRMNNVSYDLARRVAEAGKSFSPVSESDIELVRKDLKRTFGSLTF